MLSDTLDEENQPGNPYLLETVHDFLEKLKAKARKRRFPPGTKFLCKKCGECCRWYYFHLNVSERKLIDQLYMLGPPEPHGNWALAETGKLNCWMPVWKKESKTNILHFDGPLPKMHTDFLMKTERRHGYWILNKKDKIVIYSPVSCMHLTKDKLCAIYPDRPDMCREYSCGRYPIPT